MPLPLPLRMFTTWLGIFPLVLLAQWLLQPITSGWPMIFVTALSLALVVPVAVGIVLPALMKAATKLHARIRISK